MLASTWFLVFLMGTTPAGGTTAMPATVDFQRQLDAWDADHNGQLSPGEYAIGQTLGCAVLRLRWEECDQNHDGTVSAAEFKQAAGRTANQMFAEPTAAETAAERQLAEMFSLRVVLTQAGTQREYANEVTTLRKAVPDFGDEDAVIAYIVSKPAMFPRLLPLVRTFVHKYPAAPHLRRHFGVTVTTPPRGSYAKDAGRDRPSMARHARRGHAKRMGAEPPQALKPPTHASKWNPPADRRGGTTARPRAFGPQRRP